MVLLEYQNTKTFLQKDTFQIDVKKYLLLQKLKILFRGHMLLVILKAKKLLQHFTKKNCKKQIKNILEFKRYLKEKVINYMLNGKVIKIL